MVTHVVMFKLDGQGATEAALKFKKGLEELPAKIPQLCSMEVMIDNSGIEGNYTLTLRAECPDLDALKTYAAHPEHLACVAIIKPFIISRACVDYCN